jgi:hypothetical protein
MVEDMMRIKHGLARRDSAWLGWAWRGSAWLGKARAPASNEAPGQNWRESK